MKFLPILLAIYFATSCAEQAAPERNRQNQERVKSTNSETPSGKDLYLKRLDGAFTTFACASCHGLGNDGPMRRPGHDIDDATKRPNWKNGQLNEFQDAVNVCLEDWFGLKGWDADDPKAKALHTYLDAQSNADQAEALSFEIVQPPSNLSGGDINRGKTIFNKSCAICHGIDAVGGTMGPNLAGTKLSPNIIARRIRLSGPSNNEVYDGLKGGRMPFWSKSRLSDQELVDIIAYLQSTEASTTQPQNTVDMSRTSDLGVDLSLSGVSDNCGSSHPKIGQSLSFRTITHDVKGTATIIDDCTIQLKGFEYDGNGIVVQIYSGTNNNFLGGEALTVDLYRPGQPYEGDKDFYFRLPSGTSLDDFDSLSVWCVAAGISFGEGIFQ